MPFLYDMSTQHEGIAISKNEIKREKFSNNQKKNCHELLL